jgi:hypothetical protein
MTATAQLVVVKVIYPYLHLPHNPWIQHTCDIPLRALEPQPSRLLQNNAGEKRSAYQAVLSLEG